MKRGNLWFAALFAGAGLVAACGGGSGGEEMADAMDAPADVEAALSCTVMGETADRASPLQELRFSYDGGEGLLCYGAPSAREREIMGGLVPYGEPWRLGANEPTTLHLSAATSVGGVAVEAGSHSVYAVPGEMEWEFFLNSNYERWGIPIDDEVRATETGSFTAAASATEGMVEMLTFEHVDGALRMSWENTQVDISVGM